MRILITTDTVGGVFTYAVTLVRELQAAGDACFVAMFGEPSEGQVAALPAGVEWEATSLPLEWMPVEPDAIRAGSDWLRSLDRRWVPDLIHMNQFAYAADRYGAPVVVVAHSDVYSWFREVRDREPPPEWARYGTWVRGGLAGAAAVVAPTAYQSGLLARHYGRPADRVIHNGVPAPGRPDDRRASARGMVLTAGRAWDEAKAVGVLDEALERLGDRAPSAHLAGALSGPAGELYRPRRLNAHGRVPPDAMDRLYENAAVYVATSLYEPFGLTPLEAAFHGCALVLSDIGSFRELWQDAAVFVPPGSPVHLGDAILDLLEDARRLDVLAATARSRARERYTAARMAARYRELYARLTGAAGAGATRVAMGQG